METDISLRWETVSFFFSACNINEGYLVVNNKKKLNKLLQHIYSFIIRRLFIAYYSSIFYSNSKYYSITVWSD